jgi:hypothetical protein
LSKYLKYYEVLRAPTFLVVVDVVTKRGYWLFLQKYIREYLKDGAWRNKSSKRIRIPVTNTLDELVDLRKTVFEADNYLAAIHPNVTQEAIRIDQQELESLDPRIKVELEVTVDRKHYHLRAIQPVPVQFNIRSEFDTRKSGREFQKDLFERGYEVNISPGQLKVSGSPLLDHMAKELISVQVSFHKEGLMVVYELPSDRKKEFVCSLPMKIEGGMKERRVVAGGSDLPILIKMVFHRDHAKGTVQVQWDFSKWIGRRIDDLKMFSEIRSIFRALARGSDIILELLPNSGPSGRTVITNAECPIREIRHDMHHLEVLNKAIEIVRRFKLVRHLPSELTGDDEDAIELLHTLIDNEGHSIPGKRVMVSMKMGKKTAIKLLTVGENAPDGFTLNLPISGHEYNFLGESLDIGDHDAVYVFMVLSNREEILRQIESGKEEIEAQFSNSPLTRVMLKHSKRPVVATFCGENGYG